MSHLPTRFFRGVIKFSMVRCCFNSSLQAYSEYPAVGLKVKGRVSSKQTALIVYEKLMPRASSSCLPTVRKAHFSYCRTVWLPSCLHHEAPMPNISRKRAI